MSKVFPYYKMYPSDAEMDGNFRAMDDAELGFYWRCLNHSWVNGFVPADAEERARMLKTPKRIADTRWKRVGKCYVPDPNDSDRLINLRQERERAEAKLKSEMASRSVRTRYERATNVGTDVAVSKGLRSENVTPRAYDSDASSSLPGESDNLEGEEFDGAWDEHRKFSGWESKDVVYKRILSLGEKFDVARFRVNGPVWRSYWSRKGWNAYGSLTFLGWIDAGMPLPPDEDAQTRPDSKPPKVARRSCRCGEIPCICFEKFVRGPREEKRRREEEEAAAAKAANGG